MSQTSIHIHCQQLESERLRAKSEMEAVVKQMEALKELSAEMELKANLKVSD